MQLPDPILNLINNMLASEWFYISLFVWFILAIIQKDERNTTKDRVVALISKPIVFDIDETPTSVPFYPRANFERVAIAVSGALVEIPEEMGTKVSEWITAQYNFVVGKRTPWKVFGYILHLILMFFFVWADGIAIANALDALNLVEHIWPPLTYFELAVAFGSFFAIVTAALVARDLFNEGPTDLSDWDEQSGLWKKIAKYLTLALVFFGLIVVIALGLGRYERLGYIAAEWIETIQNFVNITVLILVPLNTVIATLLIHSEAFKGMMLLFMLIEGVFALAMKIIEYIAKILGAMGPFTVDVIYRLMLALLFLIVFFLFTPLDWITGLLSKRK